MLKKCAITKSIDTPIDMSVAMAAPLMPKWSTKMNIGANITFKPAPINMVTMALVG